MNQEYKNNQKNSKTIDLIVYAAIYLIACAVIGIYAGKLLAYESQAFGTLGVIRTIIFIVLIIILLTFFHVIIHEAGHLIFGLISGYEFVSFRIGPLMIKEEEGKYVLKKFKISGTSGQCLMMPDSNWNAYDYPYFLYNIGGSLNNFIVAFISLVLYLMFLENRYLSMVFIMSFVIGITGGLLNIIPLIVGGIPNDGKNILLLNKDRQSRKALYMQLYTHGLQSKGTRLKDMPEEYFELPANADLSNPLVASFGVFKSNYLHDKKEFSQAKKYSEDLLTNAPGLVDIYKNELRCELLFYEIIGLCRKDEIERLYTSELQQYIKASSSYVSRRRLMYAYEVFVNKDKEAAKKALDDFEKTAKYYPNETEIEGERELIKFIDNLAVIKNVEF